jgi:hypothetical protein
VDEALKVANAIEYWQAQGRATLSWIRNLNIDFDVLDNNYKSSDLHRWIDAAIRIVAHAQNARTLRLYPCSPAMLAVARVVCARALRSLDLTFVPSWAPFASVACLSQFSNLHTLELMMIPLSAQWTKQQPTFVPGHFPVLRRLLFSGSSFSRFFSFLSSSTFDALEDVDLQCDDTSPEDREHLHGFLWGHDLHRFVYQATETKTAEQILHMLQYVRAAQVGIYLWHLPPRYYTEIVQAIPKATRTWVVEYGTEHEDLIESLIRVIVQVPGPGIESVLVQEAGSPFHWINAETIDNDRRVGHRLTKVLGWAAVLAKRGIRMLDEAGKTLRESTAMLP